MIASTSFRPRVGDPADISLITHSVNSLPTSIHTETTETLWDLEPTASLKRPYDDGHPSNLPKEMVKANEPVKSNFEQHSLEHAQADLFTSGSFSDLKVTCKGRIWNVHKCILAVRCPAAKMTMKPFRHEDGKRFVFSMINVEDDDPDAVDSMLHYLYTKKINYSQRFFDRSIEKDIHHFLLAMGLGDKYDLPLFARAARTELEARIKASEGTALPHIVRAMHLQSASDSLVAMRDFVIGEAAALFCKGGPFNDVMEAMAIEFPKFGFDVMSHTTKELMAKIVKAEEGGGDGHAEDEDEDGDEEAIRQPKPRRYATRTMATQKTGQRAGKSRY